MDYKTTIAKLIKIANNQQKIIEKLAQQVQEGEINGVQGGTAPGATAPPPAQNLPTGGAHVDPKSAINALIMKNLVLSKAIVQSSPGAFCTVDANGVVFVQMRPGQSNQANYDAMMAIVTSVAKTLTTGQLQLKMA